MARRKERLITSEADLVAHDIELDQEICGVSLFVPDEPKLAELGAHSSSPSFYFVFEKLFAYFELDERSHVLDVGCGTGRALAYFLHAGLPGQMTGIELDPEAATVASAWSAGRDRVRVVVGSVLEHDLAPYTHFYLFNPFDASILKQFIEAIEAQVTRTVTIIHMSDNGDTWWYVGRPGWTELASGKIQMYKNARGYNVKAFDCPQHYTVWRYEGSDTN